MITTRIGEGVVTMSMTMSVVRIEDTTGTIGFIEQAGRVFVALRGRSYSVAVEVAQSLSFEGARRALLRSDGAA